jgi:putative tryptophan/tyrosine transport system substrate-binding protein
MRRRDFIKVIAGSATAWPLGAHAQQAQEMRRVGALLVLGESDPEGKVWLSAFQEGLQRLGWEQGRNIQIEYRFAGSDEHRLRTGAAELVGMRHDVLLTAGTPALVALSRETRSLPIVFVQVSDPVKLGLVASLAGLLPSKVRLPANGWNCFGTRLQAGTEWRSFSTRITPHISLYTFRESRPRREHSECT